MDKINCRAPAKLNLFLEVMDKRDDGFHNISSVMQSVDLYDDISIQLTDSTDIETFCSYKHIPDGEKNIAHKAAVKFFAYTGIKNPGIIIDIKKNIPAMAGLAGGSTDAAATLKLLNILFDAKLDIKTLRNISVEIGADVPFCVSGGTMKCEGIGEKLYKLPDLCDCIILIAFSSTRVSTPFAYSKIDDMGTRNYVINNFDKILMSRDIDIISSNLYNIFEKVVPDCKYPKDLILTHGGSGALMSGSGPSVFGIFEPDADIRRAVSALRVAGYRYAVTRPLHANDDLF